jgi:hypothetical protein
LGFIHWNFDVFLQKHPSPLNRLYPKYANVWKISLYSYSVDVPFTRVDEVDQDSYVSEVRDKFAEIFHLARKKLNDSAVCQKRNYDTRLSQNEFPVGSLVYKYNNVCRKFEENGLVPLS